MPKSIITENPLNNSKLDACVYLLQSLLQRLDAKQPGLINEMIDGVKNDKNSIPASISVPEHVHAIFDESLKILSFIQQLNSDNHKPPQ